jgi:hypothetical protein
MDFVSLLPSLPKIMVSNYVLAFRLRIFILSRNYRLTTDFIYNATLINHPKRFPSRR